MWTVHQTRRFMRQYKRLPDNTAADVDDAVLRLQQDPDAGEQKKGDLVQLRVLKFRSAGQLFLLGYSLEQSIRLISLEAVGPHENFYRDLKR